jgi:C-terminal processing protease CtpA/Prc
VEDLPWKTSSTRNITCDNRPAYHLVHGPSAKTHRVGYNIFYGLLKDSKPGENLYGMTWDSLWGPSLTGRFQKINREFASKARGVVLDHRTGNGGTIDAPEAITELVRTPLDIAIFLFERPSPGYEGPASPAEGLAIFDRFKNYHQPDLTYSVGGPNPSLDLPVALLIHRDGSASDYLPFGMKGAPKVRIFGPHATAGAFSSFVQIGFWGSLALRMARGDTISYRGTPLIGKGVEPDEVVLQKQSDLLHGRDTIYRAALAWVRKEARP